jgi:tyrosyl-tRNA synthetase
LTTPLVLRGDGTKFGKSAGENVWLAAERTSPYELYQFFMRTEDAVVGKYLRYFTWLDRERIEELDRETATRPEARAAQRALAFEVTALVHGRSEAERARRASEVLFSEEIASLDEPTLLSLMAEAPTATAARGVALVDALQAAGLVESKSDARRQIKGGGVYVNNRRVADEGYVLDGADLLHGRYAILRRGKAQYALLRVE